MKKVKIDIPFLISVIILVGGGFLIFTSASLGLLTGQEVKYSNVVFNQTFFGLFLGLLACVFTTQFEYKKLRQYSFFIFILGIVATLLVFVPGIGVSHGGAHRWLALGPISLGQPSEILKIASIIFFAAWLASAKDKVQTFSRGFLPYVVLIAINGAVLLAQPDTDTFVIICVALTAMFLVAGGRWRYIISVFLIGVIGIATIAYQRPYVKERINTFMNPAENTLGSGYQINQALIAIGSGGLTGRGFGQSIQKFNNFLPEPIGDSIFAVAGEEFGFIGTVGIIFLFIFFTFRGLKIAGKVADPFGRLMVVGIVIMITAQAFVNMAAMVGVIPLSGIPLPFISHGGTALFVALAEVGIILNISKHTKK